MRKYSPEQKNYMAVKAAYDLANGLRSKDPLNQKINAIIDDDNKIDEVITLEMELDNKYNITALRDQLIQAENSLMKWMHEKIKSEGGYYKNRQQIQELLSKGIKYLPIREKVIALALQLNPA